MLARPALSLAGLLIGTQSLILLLGLAFGEDRRRRGGNPSDVYTIAGLAYGAAWLAVSMCALSELRRAKSADRPARFTWPRDGQLALVALAAIWLVVEVSAKVAAVASVVLSVVRHLLSLAGQPRLTLTVFEYLFAGSMIFGIALAAGALYWQCSDAHSKGAYLMTGAALVPCAMLVQLSFCTCFELPQLAMTDAALVHAFERLEGPPVELAARPSPRFFELRAVVRGLRAKLGTPASLSYQAARVMAERRQMGLSGLNLQPTSPPLPDYPELDLLRVLAQRGELAEPEAWLSDAGVPLQLRWEVAGMLTELERSKNPGALTPKQWQPRIDATDLRPPSAQAIPLPR